MPNTRHISARSTTVEEDVNKEGVSRLEVLDCGLRSDDDGDDDTANAAVTAALATEVINGGDIVLIIQIREAMNVNLSRRPFFGGVPRASFVRAA